jgi:alpha-1,2-mannosyltransferase
VWGILRRQWHMVIASTLTLLAITLVAIQMYGLRHYIDYLPVLSFLSMHGEAYYPNQSVNGLMNRLLINGDSLHFDVHGFPPYNPAVYICTLISALFIIGTALLYKMKEKPNTVDLALVMLSLTIASPITWEHHYGVLLPIFGLLAPIWLSNRPVSKPVLVYLVIAFFLTSQHLPFTNRWAYTYLNIFQSYLLFGATMVLVMLYRTRQSMPPSWRSCRGIALARSNP